MSTYSISSSSTAAGSTTPRKSNDDENDNNNNNQKVFTNSSSSNKSKSFTKIEHAVKECIAGALAGMLAKSAVAPIERVKLLMQLKGESGNAFEVTRKVYSNQGILAFWRGNLPNVLSQGGTAALNFLLMDEYKKVIAPIMAVSGAYLIADDQKMALKKRKRALLSSFLSGGFAGGTALTIFYPLVFLRTRLAMDRGTVYTNDQSKSRMYPNGMRDVLKMTLKTNGVKGLFEGYRVAFCGVIVYRSLHLGGYDAMKFELARRYSTDTDQDTTKLPFYQRFLAAQIVSLVAGTVCYPIDSVRRRLMMQSGIAREERLYKGGVDCFQKVFRSEGIKGFYLGIGPNIIRSVGGALVLVAYDGFKGILN